MKLEYLLDHYQNVLVPLRLTAEAEEEEAEIYEQILGSGGSKEVLYVRWNERHLRA